MNNLMDILGCLKKAKKAVICGHIMPDGDSIGSVLAMKRILSELGIEATVVVNQAIPAMFGFLSDVNSIQTPERFPENCDTAVILDSTDLGRLGDAIRPKVEQIQNIINIDHHVSNSKFGTCYFVDTDAAATGEIVFELIRLLNIELDQALAAQLYTAIVMDTGGFMYENTTAKSHQIAAELLKTGIDAPGINKHLFDNKELVQQKLLGYALAQLKTTARGKIAWTSIPLRVMHELGALDEHADGIVNYPRSIRGVEIGLLIREVEPQKIKIGFRSKRAVDVNKVAAIFNGGGHPRASGCLIEGSLEEVEKKVIEACIQSLEEEP